MLPSLSKYQYTLPESQVANSPCHPRDLCRLLVLNRITQNLSHHKFINLIDLLGPDDVLVLNQSKVFPARIFGSKLSGGQVELLLLHPINSHTWLSISKPGLKEGTIVNFQKNLSAQVQKRNITTGEIEIEFNHNYSQLMTILDAVGSFPLPPYIKSPLDETSIRQDYQTVFAQKIGSAAAPTAGLHFSQNMLDDLKTKGIQIEYLTLHVGLGTFKPLSEENLKTKTLHKEFYEIDLDVAKRLNQAKKSGKRIIAVGTTSLRTLESAAIKKGNQFVLRSGKKSTDIFIYPPYQFKFTDSLITNFHLPESSLLMLVSAFVSYPNTPHKFQDFLSSPIGLAYQTAINNNYRFYSFGDAMWIY